MDGLLHGDGDGINDLDLRLKYQATMFISTRDGCVLVDSG